MFVCAVFGSDTAFASVVFGVRCFLFASDLHMCHVNEYELPQVCSCSSFGRSLVRAAICNTPNEVGTNDRNDTDAQSTQHNESSLPNILKASATSYSFSACFLQHLLVVYADGGAKSHMCAVYRCIHKPSTSHSHLQRQLHFTTINIRPNTRRQPLLAQKWPAKSLMMECEFTGWKEMSRVVCVVVWSLYSFGIYRNLICPFAIFIAENSNDNTNSENRR